MNLRLYKFILAIIITGCVYGLSGPTIVFGQTDNLVTGTNNFQVSEPPSTTAPVYDPSKVIPLPEPASLTGSSILGSLRMFGESIGMSFVDPRSIVARIIKSALSFIGIIVLVLILWSGLMIMTAGGDEEKSQNARKGCFNTLIGLFIILSAYSIVTFILNAFSNSTDNAIPAAVTNESAPPANPVIRDPVVNP